MFRNSKPKAVVFDLDGLMFNTEDLYQDVGSELLRRRGKDFGADLVDAMMGRPADVSLQLMIEWHGLDSTVDQLAAETDEIFATLLDERLAVMPGLLPLLAKLEEAGLPKAIATSSGPDFVGKVLGKFDLARRFKFVLTCDDISHGKPHPEIYLLAARRFGFEPRELLVLEDSQNGCRSAIAAGTLTVAVPAGHSRRHDFSGAALIADSLADARLWALLGIEPASASAL
ncbi:MAG: HAD-IA family hydrolase [Planctomycetia bacterium]|nr:HAD-IA family hydrolase [Planctomycetia bacterium]